MNKLKTLGLVAITSFILVGCSNTGSTTQTYMSNDYQEGIATTEIGRVGFASDNVVKEANISIETVTYQEDKQAINNAIKENNAKLVSLNESTGAGYRPYTIEGSNKTYYNSTYVVTLPSDNLDSFIDKIDNVGHVLNKNIGSEDVTKNVIDLESRIKTYDTRIAKYNELLEQASNIEDVITLQERLEEAIANKEGLLREQDDLDTKIQESTVHIHLTEVEVLQDGYTHNESFTGRLSEAFSQSWVRFKSQMQEFALSLVRNLPIIIVVGIFITIIVKSKNAFLKYKINKRTKVKQKKDDKIDN